MNNTTNINEENKKTKRQTTGTQQTTAKRQTTGTQQTTVKRKTTGTQQTTVKRQTTGTQQKATKKSGKSKGQVDEIVRKSFKRTSGFMFRLLINLIIIFIVVSIFSYAFNFTYSVFGDTAKDPDSTEYIIVEIPADSSIINIGEALEDAGVIDDKYVFYVKVVLKQYGDKIRPGKYGLSASMDFSEIMQIICDFDEEE